MPSNQRMTRTLAEKFAGFERCKTLAQTGTYFGCSIEQMEKEDLLAVIGHMVELKERDQQRRADYIHSSAVAKPTGGMSPRSPSLR